MAELKDIGKYIDEVMCGEKMVPGIDVIVMQDHREIYRHITGFCDKNLAESLEKNQLYYLYSCTKPITAAAALRLVEEGKLDLDAPVSNYIPEFAELTVQKDDLVVPAQKVLTVRHLFTMTGGFTYQFHMDSSKEFIEKNPNASTLEIVKNFAKIPLADEPGQCFRYSVCHDILAAVIEVVSSVRYGEYLEQVVFKPLGMTNTTFNCTEEIKEKIAYQFYCPARGERPFAAGSNNNNFIFTPNYESGGAGLISTMDDYIKFADCMACGGTSKDGYQLLKPETVKMMHTEQLSDYTMDSSFGCAAGPGYGYGLGVRTRISHEGGKSPLGEFGWDGAAGCYIMMDDTNKISIVMGMSVIGWPNCIGYDHGVVRDIVYEALNLA